MSDAAHPSEPQFTERTKRASAPGPGPCPTPGCKGTPMPLPRAASDGRLHWECNICAVQFSQDVWVVTAPEEQPFPDTGLEDSVQAVSASVQPVPQRSRRQSLRNPIKIAIANIKATYPKGTVLFPIQEICLRMDKKRQTNHTLEVLPSWSKISGSRLWVENYNCKKTKNRVSKYISDVLPAV
jgi:hypothetical protein